MRYESNWGDPGAWFDAAVGSFGLDSPSHKAPTVGGRALRTIAEGIHDRCERRVGPDGQGWARNAPSTIRRKGKDDPNHHTNAMTSLAEIEGEQTVAHREAAMVYGKTPECKAKAHYAETGQGSTGITRPLYWITGDDADKVLEGFEDDLISHITKG